VPGLPLWQQPTLGPELFYDDVRHVLELLPVPGTSPIAPLPGLAVDVTGEIYRVNERGELVRRHCDGCEAPLLCEPGVLVSPAGLALDRRGFLYVADPGAHRVVVMDPDDGSVVGVLVEGLKEPVDVAISPTGRIYVADRVAGEISRWSPRFSRRGAFKAISPEGLPANPQPIQVFVESDGSIGVVDANHPRILRFSAGGAGLGDREFQGLTRNLPADRDKPRESMIKSSVPPEAMVMVLVPVHLMSRAAEFAQQQFEKGKQQIMVIPVGERSHEERLDRHHHLSFRVPDYTSAMARALDMLPGQPVLFHISRLR